MIYTPFGSGPFPLVIINHGTPSEKSDLAGRKIGFGKAARWFVSKGFIVLVVLRPGFGASEGAYLEGAGPCDRLDYIAGGRRTAAVETAIAKSAAQLPGVDPHRIIIVGQSAGGFGAVALADEPPPGVIGVISFAGGRGSNGTGHICEGSSELIHAMSVFGKHNRLPQLWLYAENDRYFPPVLAKSMHSAYSTASSSPVVFALLSSFRDDGHRTLADADPSSWTREVQRYLDSILQSP
ncbi:alpha/beta hydrolase [Sphingomonas sp. QA11]|uniref:alpha/beta hydrolase family protein n=1 Tax=Sphingomonas sp. QA11 TaxID=2950605 RepID=UPI00234B55AC|nr:alpha/beta hydrolase [Sphingomonas sp. QA11]WCM25912.1 alpha/beta hydrolase [Sphingomonas sp. QA11]